VKSFIRIFCISAIVAGLIILAGMGIPGEFGSIVFLPGSIIHLMWDVILFELTNDPYYSLGDGTFLFSFIFYLLIIFFFWASIRFLNDTWQQDKRPI
jgi:hypothetical protein